VSHDTRRYTPKSETERLSLGSYEYLIGQVKESIGNAKAKLFPGVASFDLISTFQSHAIVETDAGFFDVAFVQDAGRYVATSATKIVVESYDADSMVDFLKKEAELVIECVCRGDKDSATDKIRRLLALTPAKFPVSEGELAALVIAKAQADRPWKRMLKDQGDSIRKVAGSVSESSLSPKFERLVQGKVLASSLGEYDTLVQQSLAEIDNRITKARDLAKSSGEKVKDSTIEGLVERIGFFAEDLGLDLAEVSRSLSVVRNRVHDLRFLAEVYDAVVPELAKYELAARFLEKSASISGPRGPA